MNGTTPGVVLTMLPPGWSWPVVTVSFIVTFCPGASTAGWITMGRLPRRPLPMMVGSPSTSSVSTVLPEGAAMRRLTCWVPTSANRPLPTMYSGSIAASAGAVEVRVTVSSSSCWSFSRQRTASTVESQRR